MNKLISISLTVLLLSSCTQKKTKEQLSHLDPSSSDSFIQSLIDNRKDQNADKSDFSISGKTLYSKGGFHIINFLETSGSDSMAYVILLNPGDPTSIDTTEKLGYTELQKLLETQAGVTPGLLKGRLEPAPDLVLDGSPDFILRHRAHKGYEVTGFQRVFLYNGQNKLTPTAIQATTHYVSARPLTGVNESIESRQDSVASVIIHHSEDSAGVQPVYYDMIWRWSKTEKTWQTGFKAQDLDRPEFTMFTKRLTYLESNGASFTIPENCQSGGAIYFELNRKTDDLSDYYVIKTGIEDAGYNLVYQIIKKDASTYVLYKARGEQVHVANPLGEPEIRRDSTDATIIIKNDPVKKDIYWVQYSYSPVAVPYTVQASKYKFIKCQ